MDLIHEIEDKVEIKILKRKGGRGSYIEKCWENIHREI